MHTNFDKSFESKMRFGTLCGEMNSMQSKSASCCCLIFHITTTTTTTMNRNINKIRQLHHLYVSISEGRMEDALNPNFNSRSTSRSTASKSRRSCLLTQQLLLYLIHIVNSRFPNSESAINKSPSVGDRKV